MPIPVAADAPLVVTARLDPAAFAILDGMRQRYFPAALNKVPAHISLFHHLPGGELRNALATLRDICAGFEPIDLAPLPPRFLGRGVALAYEAAALTRLHGALAGAWADWLTPQDRQPFRAHVTIQNKVAPEAARTLLAAIHDLPPVPCRVEGLDVWRYRGGPCEAMATVMFDSSGGTISRR